MKPRNDAVTHERAACLNAVLNRAIRDLTPQERDRRLQSHFAQARGPLRNLQLMFETTTMILHARKLYQYKDTSNVRK